MNSRITAALFVAILILLPMTLSANTCLEFDGVDDYVEVNTVLPDSGTIELWYYPESFYDWNTLFDNSVDPNDWEMWIYYDGVLRFRLDDGYVSCDLNALGGTKHWYHIAVMWEKQNSRVDLQLYVNGVLRESKLNSNWVNPGSTFYLGGGNGNTSGTGKFDELRLWDSMLDPFQINEKMYQPLTGTEPGLIGYYNFDEGSGGFINDMVTSNTGTLYNMDNADWVESILFNPIVQTVSPADNSTDISLESNLVITFDRNVTAGAGNLVIHRTSDDSILETIPAASTVITDSIVTIDPANSFILQKGYYVTIEGNAFHDGSGNYFEGIYDDTIWNFTSLNYFTEINAGIQGLDNGNGDWGDYDNDGDLDFMLTGAIDITDYLLIYQNINGDFFESGGGLEANHSRNADWGDYDNDGDLDILLTDGGPYNNLNSKIYRNDSGGFTDINAALAINIVNSGEWLDYDSDGDLDIFLTGFDEREGQDGFDPRSKIYLNKNGLFTETDFDFTSGILLSTFWVDYDNDSDLDFLAIYTDSVDSEITNYYTEIYRNDSGVFTDINAGLTGVAYGSAVWGDYDSDGDLDLLLHGADMPNEEIVSKIYRNDSGVFTDINAGLSGIFVSSAVWGDYDNDGDLDILITGSLLETENDVTRIYKNDNGNFTDFADISELNSGRLKWGDYDNDGDLDFLAIGSLVSKLYRNNSLVANTAPNSPNNISYEVSGTGIDFLWDKASDNETPAKGLSYNIDIDINGVQATPYSSDPASGYRKIVGLGNAYLNNFYKLPNLMLAQEETKNISTRVQAIDNCYAGSVFAESDGTIVSRDLTVISLKELDSDGLLTWEIAFSASVLNYQLQLDDDINFNSPIEEVISFNKDEKEQKLYFSVVLRELADFDSLVKYTKYYWRIKPNYTDRISRFTLTPLNFIFNPTTAPYPVNIEVVGEFVTLSWNNVKDAEKGEVYNVYSSDDPHAVFPEGWDLEISGLPATEWITRTSERKKFYCVTAAGAVK